MHASSFSRKTLRFYSNQTKNPRFDYFTHCGKPTYYYVLLQIAENVKIQTMC